MILGEEENLCLLKCCKFNVFISRTYFSFPQDPSILKEWTAFLGISGRPVREGSVLCSAHFSAMSFENQGSELILKKDAVPSIRWVEHIYELPLRGRLFEEYSIRKVKKKRPRSKKSRKPPTSKAPPLDFPIILEGDKELEKGILPWEKAYMNSMLVVGKVAGASQSRALFLQAAFNRSIGNHVGFVVNYTVNEICTRHVHGF